MTCFMCEKCLDGWEEEDSPALEHLHHSPDCAWATIACVESADKLEDYEREHPMGDNMTEARRATFADHWPHESKKGWTCKTEKVRYPRSASGLLLLLGLAKTNTYADGGRRLVLLSDHGIR